MQVNKEVERVSLGSDAFLSTFDDVDVQSDCSGRRRVSDRVFRFYSSLISSSALALSEVFNWPKVTTTCLWCVDLELGFSLKPASIAPFKRQQTSILGHSWI